MSPFYHFNARFDPEEIMRRHAVAQLKARAGFITNFLGVIIDPHFFPTLLDGRAGEVEEIPIPANWHADMAEWGAVLRAVDLSQHTFTMAELGCGWGCWMNNSGVAAKRAGRNVHLLGIEGDEGHIAFAQEALKSNGFNSSEFTLHRGIAASDTGTALFPKQASAGMSWGLKPRFGVSDAERRSALDSGDYDALPMIPLAEVLGNHSRVDLLHIDIQGGEADLVSACLALLSETVAYIVIGTHSRQIEGRLFDLLLRAGWWLEIERPAILSLDNDPIVTVDGVQGWRNPTLLPIADVMQTTG
ncbi:MAG: class I SAM-dependent methyltransferase, partial [Anaerolineae bacterium]|nr:class I SAM-dependent methyltransferase [Anaerolineae bacterium]